MTSEEFIDGIARKVMDTPCSYTNAAGQVAQRRSLTELLARARSRNSEEVTGALNDYLSNKVIALLKPGITASREALSSALNNHFAVVTADPKRFCSEVLEYIDTLIAEQVLGTPGPART